MTPADIARAVDLALSGHWDEAHGIVQEDEADPAAAWVHAVLHKIEGDTANARYWYRRAGRLDCVDREHREELQSIRDSLGG
ncbi:MAG: hypothetical protein DWI03_09455 [Planctomycetota bacterium]|jgi:hypothetical protein|nr:MAG: hypothetical protein DWI03_09455 [Planctomycetota bacterium]